MRHLIFTLFLTLIMCSVPTFASASCPIKVLSVGQFGIEPVVRVQNDSDDPYRITMFLMTFDDGLGQPHEKDYPSKILLQPHQIKSYRFPAIVDAVVRWETLDASVTCKAASADSDSVVAPKRL